MNAKSKISRKRVATFSLNSRRHSEIYFIPKTRYNPFNCNAQYFFSPNRDNRRVFLPKRDISY